MNCQKWCLLCRGMGIMRASNSRRWVACICGRLVNSKGAWKLAKQDALDKRLVEVKEGKW
jgi:hypothetical protein